MKAATAPLPLALLPDTATIGDQGQLLIGGCDTLELAAEFGTPLFVYDEAHLRARCTEAVEAFGDGVAYATKAFLCRAMAQVAHECGMHLDVATAGELHVAMAAGVPAERLVMHGNNKSMTELETALSVGVGRIVVDSFDELDRLDMLAARGVGLKGGGPAKILLRMTPGIEAHTHEFIATGQDDSKFGFTVSSGLAGQAVERAIASPAVELLGLHAHIGSQVFSIESLRQSATIIAAMAAPYDLPELSVGGGLGVAYIDGEEGLTITQWARVVKDAVAATGCTAQVLAEPGRSIAAGAAITLYTVGTIKHLPDIRTYVAVDGGMSDNPRPVLYGSGYETFLPRAVEARRARTITVVGKHCESGDTLVRDGTVPDDIAVGDVLATPVTGAYGYSMGSNYQHVLRPAVVFVADGEARPVVRRQTLDDLLRYDIAP